MPHSVIVTAPSRLHFGLFSLASGTGRQFGGVGAMLKQPGLKLRIESAPAWSACGPLAGRIQDAADRWRGFHSLAVLPECRVTTDYAPPEHVGLGLGTQLSLSVAAGLSSFCELPASAPQELALSVGRSQRSAIGTYGFAFGGIIVEQGKLPGEPISPIDTRIDIPADWRFVLVRPLGVRGLSGDVERAALDRISVSPETTTTLIREVREHLVPAAATGDFESFSSSIFRYGALAGTFYVVQQGGAYNGPVLSALVERIRSWGIAGVGQSSWGPTLFVVQRDDCSARRLVDRLHMEWDGPQLDLVIAQPDNRGAIIEVSDDEPAPTR
jgi:beta-ribofuranosylaminobenzene 5'-phosphate synthase